MIVLVGDVGDQLRHGRPAPGPGPSTTPAELAYRLRRLRPTRIDLAHLLGELAEVANEIERLVVPPSPRVLRVEARADPSVDARIKRLAALADHHRREAEKLRELLAMTQPRPRQRRGDDQRQGQLL